MSEVYLHQVFSGRRSPSRDRLLCLCLGLAVSLLTGCARTIDEIIEEEPSVRGTVAGVNAKYFLLDVDREDPAYETASRISVSRDVENADSYTSLKAGDHVAVYFDGVIAESYPAQISTVYAVLYIGET